VNVGLVWFSYSPHEYVFVIQYLLVGGAITILKNDGVKVNGKDYSIPSMKWKIKFMFQTTNQYIYIYTVANQSAWWIIHVIHGRLVGRIIHV